MIKPNRKYYKLFYDLLVTFFFSAIITTVMTVIYNGFNSGFFITWLKSFIIGSAIAYPISEHVLSNVGKISNKLFPVDSVSGENLYLIPNGKLDDEISTVLHDKKNIRIEKIVSQGHTTEWYDQTQYEFVSLLSGEAVLEFENGRLLKLTKGDNILIEPHQIHRVASTSKNPPCIWLCVFFDE